MLILLANACLGLLGFNVDSSDCDELDFDDVVESKDPMVLPMLGGCFSLKFGLKECTREWKFGNLDELMACRGFLGQSLHTFRWALDWRIVLCFSHAMGGVCQHWPCFLPWGLGWLLQQSMDGLLVIA